MRCGELLQSEYAVRLYTNATSRTLRFGLRLQDSTTSCSDCISKASQMTSGTMTKASPTTHAGLRDWSTTQGSLSHSTVSHNIPPRLNPAKYDQIPGTSARQMNSAHNIHRITSSHPDRPMSRANSPSQASKGATH